MEQYKSIPFDQYYLTAAHDNDTTGHNYYQCIAKIKKIISPYMDHVPVVVEMNLTQMYRGYQTPIRKECNLVIHQFQYENNLSDVANTYCAFDNMVNFDVKFLYDTDYIYVYVRSKYETYGGYIVIQPKKVYGAKRVEIINNANFETLPSLSELKTCLSQTNLNYFLTAPGDADYTKYTKIAELKVKIGDGTTLPSAVTASFTLMSTTSNATRFAKFYAYLTRLKTTTDGDLDKSTILYGYNGMTTASFYTVINIDTDPESPTYNIKTMSIYTRLLSSGSQTRIKLDDYIGESTLPNKNILLYENQPYYLSSEITGTVITTNNGV